MYISIYRYPPSLNYLPCHFMYRVILYHMSHYTLNFIFIGASKTQKNKFNHKVVVFFQMRNSSYYL